MAAHARGVAYAAKAAGLAAPDDPAAVAREAEWHLRHASPAVRKVLKLVGDEVVDIGTRNRVHS